jgi:hypothetical protein
MSESVNGPYGLRRGRKYSAMAESDGPFCKWYVAIFSLWLAYTSSLTKFKKSQRTLSFHVGLLCALFCLRVDSAQNLIRILQSSHFPKRCVFVSIPHRILADLAALKVQLFWVSPPIPPTSKARLKRRDIYVGLPLVPRQVPLLPGEYSFFPAM